MIITNEHMEKVEGEKLGPGVNADNPGVHVQSLFIVVEHFYAQAPFYAQSVSERSLGAQPHLSPAKQPPMLLNQLNGF